MSQAGMLEFNLVKEGGEPIVFSLSKVQKYIVELYWESQHDLDAHAIALKNHKVLSGEGVLSTYNGGLVQVDNPTVNHVSGGKEAFRNKASSLIHQGDRRSGISANSRLPDEVLIVDLPKLVSGENEVAFFVTNHPPRSAKFREVNDAKIVIKDDSGAVLLTANLTHDFDDFDMVQMGSLVLNEDTQGWEFNPQAAGINGTFNDIMRLLQ